MPDKKPVDWTSVDWSQQNRDIAEQLKVSPPNVTSMRLRLGKPRPRYHRRQRGYAAFIKRWSKVDWRETNAAIGRKMNVSRERARQMRLLLGKRSSNVGSSAQPLKKRAKGTILGRNVALEVSVRNVLNRYGVFRDGLRKHPWHLINFQLGNTALANIWGIRRDVIAIRRYQHRLGPAKWSGMVYGSHRAQSADIRYCRWLVKERAKAIKWKTSVRQSVFPVKMSPFPLNGL